MDRIFCHVSIAISVSMLAVVASYPVLAKPQLKSKVVVISQVVTKANSIEGISPQPVEAILASVKLKQVSQQKARKAVVSPVTKPKAVTPFPKVSRQVSDYQSSQGIATFIDVDRTELTPDHSRAIDRWTN